MKTLHLYLTRQMLATLGMTVFVFTLMILLGNGIKELLQLVVRRQATIGMALHAIALLVPYVLAFSLPVGMLTAALLVFGRFSAEQELTAARASGISLVSLITPILLLSLGVCAVCAWLNFEVAPSSRMAYKELLHRAASTAPANFLTSGESVRLGGRTIYVGKVHEDKTNLESVIVYTYDKGQLTEVISGGTGTIEVDPAEHQIVLKLYKAHSMSRLNNGWNPTGDADPAIVPIPFEPEVLKVEALPISDMTFNQLLSERAQIEQDMGQAYFPGKKTGDSLAALKDLEKLTSDRLTEVKVYLHREVSFSFACFGFTLIGIPLGIRSHRRETSAGIAMALVLMLVYYSFIVLAQAWSQHPERVPYLVVWLPNFIFQAVGSVMLWKANRGI